MFVTQEVVDMLAVQVVRYISVTQVVGYVDGTGGWRCLWHIHYTFGSVQ